jgi:carbon starvation protein
VSLPLLSLVVLGSLALGYRFYGRFVARQFALDDADATPAGAREDGVDFVPTRPFYLLGQHFSAIAAAGPIAGPILACQQFGWLPCILWIGLGVIFIGAVHDFAALVASVRHDGRSIAEIIRVQLGHARLARGDGLHLGGPGLRDPGLRRHHRLHLRGQTEDLEGMAFPFNPGGAVAMASSSTCCCRS